MYSLVYNSKVGAVLLLLLLGLLTKAKIVDGKPISIDIPYNGEPETATVPIAAGTHTITWNFHQNAGDISMAELGPIELVGVTAGMP